MGAPTVHMLWIEGELGQIEQLSIRSFLRNGFDVVLWHYGDVRHIPEGVKVQPASLVLDASELFNNGEGYLAGASDLFRYAVLHAFGGMWADLDVIAMKPVAECPTFRFIVMERDQNGLEKVNGNVIHYPDPEENDVMDMLYTYAKKFPKHKVSHLEIAGPLVTAMTSVYPGHGIQVMPVSFANPYGWFDCPRRLFTNEPLPDSHFIHLYSGMWHREFKERYREIQNAPFPENSILGQLQERYP